MAWRTEKLLGVAPTHLSKLLPLCPHQLPPGNRHAVRADGSLHLDRALQEDAGRYSCVATNAAGSQHRDVELVVQGES